MGHLGQMLRVGDVVELASKRELELRQKRLFTNPRKHLPASTQTITSAISVACESRT
jgi:hypothetical protein